MLCGFSKNRLENISRGHDGTPDFGVDHLKRAGDLVVVETPMMAPLSTCGGAVLNVICNLTLSPRDEDGKI